VLRVPVAKASHLEVQCLKKPRSNELAKQGAPASHQPLKLVNSCARKFITFGKASTALDRRSRRLRLGSRRRGKLASSYRRRRPALLGARSRARHPRTGRRVVAAGRRRPNGPGLRNVPSNVRAAPARPEKLYPVRRGPLHADDRPRPDARRHARPPGRVGDEGRQHKACEERISNRMPCSN
jgi:hypothetical protein